jgi:hypothetical protein
MVEKQVWLDKHRAPSRNARNGYEFEADCGLQRIVVETDKEITAGLDEGRAQELLRELRPRIEKAARRRHESGDAYPESPRPGITTFRIAITTDDLQALGD